MALAALWICPIFKTEGMLTDKALVVELLFHNEMSDTQSKGSVSSWIYRDPLVGLRCRDGIAGFHLNDFGSDRPLAPHVTEGRQYLCRRPPCLYEAAAEAENVFS